MDKKVLDTKSIQKKAMKKLKKLFEGTGIKLHHQAESEILKAIQNQSESNLEEIVAENLAIDIIGNLNAGIKKD